LLFSQSNICFSADELEFATQVTLLSSEPAQLSLYWFWVRVKLRSLASFQP